MPSLKEQFGLTLEAWFMAITLAILRQECGSNLKSVHAQMVARLGLHNPGHLISARQRGAQPVRLSPQGHLWAGWKSYAEGVDGVRRQVRLDISRGLTLRELTSKYAPAVENDTAAYLRNVSVKAELEVDKPIQPQSA